LTSETMAGMATPLFKAEQISTRIDSLVEEIGAADWGGDFVLVGVLRGSFMFLSDLVRGVDRLDLRPRIDFMTLESYHGGTESTSKVPRMIKDVSVDLTDSHVLIVDDILDTGRTLTFALQHLRNKGAASVRSCVLLDKPSRRLKEVEAEFVGFEIEDKFVVGYGLDYDNRYRELPYIGVYEE